MNFKIIGFLFSIYIVNAQYIRTTTQDYFDDDGLTFARDRNVSSETEDFDVTIIEEDFDI